MGKSGRERNRGVTLIEVMVGAVIIAVAVLGAINFQEYCAMHARWADVRATAGRIGLIAMEGWKGVAGSTAWDPLEPFEAHPEEFTLTERHGNEYTGSTIYEPGWRRFVVRAERMGVEYHVTLSYSESEVEPDRLLACVAWKNNLHSSDPPDREIFLEQYANYTVGTDL
ncbi:MAG: type IV pilus modification PilV family protein [Planctomycetota bacterium]|jgi:prepilin-type N-terminal cleavage/methylation domain-containing protein